MAYMCVHWLYAWILHRTSFELWIICLNLPALLSAQCVCLFTVSLCSNGVQRLLYVSVITFLLYELGPCSQLLVFLVEGKLLLRPEVFTTFERQGQKIKCWGQCFGKNFNRTTTACHAADWNKSLNRTIFTTMYSKVELHRKWAIWPLIFNIKNETKKIPVKYYKHWFYLGGLLYCPLSELHANL